MLCDFYTNIGKTIENKIPQSKWNLKDYLTQPNHNKILHKPCTELEITDIIKSLNVSKSAGPNSIPTNLIHTSSIILIPILTIILINNSLTQGSFPSILKLAEICPIFKKGDFDNCGNYRPISLLSNLGKILEKVMYTRLSKFLENNNILFEKQFGFRKQHDLVDIVEQIKTLIGVFVDLGKRIWHSKTEEER